MSRVDEEREAARRAEKLMLEKRDKESREKNAQAQASSFSKKVSQSAQHTIAQQKEGVGKSTLAKILEAPREGGEAKKKQEQQKGLAGKMLSAQKQSQEQTLGRAEGHEGQQSLAQSRGADGQAASQQAEGRSAEARVARTEVEKDEEKKELLATSSGFSEAAESEAPKDAESGNSGNQDRKDGDTPRGELPAGFRFNPALMAPVPLARPRDLAGSDRLRALATEIAQKIVESARVGINAAGKAEFQIDLRSNVLAGLSITVSGSSGKIRALFAGRDREVLKLLKEQGEVLKNALSSRGLTLEEFRIEERP